ncbi:hypothetical protein BZA77DRAFT_278518 [Pyronema omphalodes]|nr:hypothetical protein BZA77DRAFT_278518 [Pyronema omphalodes]
MSTISAGVSLRDLPRSAVFTKSLPCDKLFPTPRDSAKSGSEKLGPRQVKEALYTYVRPTPATANPELLAISPAAFRDLGLKLEEAETKEFVDLVAGNGSYEDADENGVYPWAQCYGGYQFGQFAGQLGDGRAISLFEGTNPATGKRYEVQLKGAGKTPYSRFADGRAVLRSSIREFVVSEYLNSIGIPTTRALALTLLPNEMVVREKMEVCAIVARMAESWIRIGTFDIFRARGDRVRLRQLCDYVHDEVLKLTTTEGNRYEAMYREIVKRNAKVLGLWQAYGFMNGVLNTDNTSIYGLSLDFGPFAFMDKFDPSYTPNHDDYMLRYSFRNQPTIIWWNLIRLAEDIAELMKVEKLVASIANDYRSVFLSTYNDKMTEKMGFKTFKEEDFDSHFSPVLDLMQKYELDYHQFFRKLSETPVEQIKAEIFLPDDAKDKDIKDVDGYLDMYKKRLDEEGITDETRIPQMKKVNPKFVPKNWVLDEIIKRVERDGERDVLKDVVKCVMEPFNDTWEGVQDAERWCGPVPKEQMAMQCSCSS